MTSTVEIKGIREGLLVTLGEGPWSNVQDALMQEVDQQASFLEGAKLILDVENHILNAAALSKLRDLLSEKGMNLWAVLSNSPTTEITAQTLGLATKIHQTASEDGSSLIEHPDWNGNEAILIKQTLRSGRRIEFIGHVTVVGDVNPGAEVISGGDVVVWGKLRGLVHAGAEGDESAVVCALNLAPTQLRIASKISVPPKDREEIKPEIASIRDGQVIAESWQI